MSDSRLEENRQSLAWFQEWGSAKNRSQKNFITRECFEDLLSLFIGFEQIVSNKLMTCPFSTITPSRINSDVVENIFCSQRGICNGSTTNPTYLQYTKGMNTILLGQTIKSKKANAAGSKTIRSALPYKMHSKKSFKALRL